MLTRVFPRTGWRVGVIGLGTWAVGGQWGPVERDTAAAAVDAALDAGANFIDTADVYGTPPGESERFLAGVLKTRRDRVFLATKVGHFARRYGHGLSFSHWLHVELCCDASLHRLGVDHIDLYQCHLADCAEPEVFLEAFDRLIAAGKIRAFGVSTHRLDVAQAFDRDGRCAAVQLDYSFVNREAESRLLPYCQERGIGVIVRGPLAQGIAAGKFNRATVFEDEVRRKWNEGAARAEFLQRVDLVERVRAAASTQRPLSQTALGFVISHPAVTVAIPGAKDAQQARLNGLAGAATLPPSELDAIRSASAPTAERAIV